MTTASQGSNRGSPDEGSDRWTTCSRSVPPQITQEKEQAARPVGLIRTSPSRHRQLHATCLRYDRRPSVVFAEYTVVLGVVVLTVGLALYGLGVPLVQSYYLAKLFILLPIP